MSDDATSDDVPGPDTTDAPGDVVATDAEVEPTDAVADVPVEPDPDPNAVSITLNGREIVALKGERHHHPRATPAEKATASQLKLMYQTRGRQPQRDSDPTATTRDSPDRYAHA